MRAKPNDHRLLNILRQKTDDVDVKKHAVFWVQQAVRATNFVGHTDRNQPRNLFARVDNLDTNDRQE